VGLLDEPGLDALLAAGCPDCGGRRVSFRAYLDGLLPLIGGDPCGQIKWVHDGERFVDGVYQASCAGCARVLFSADVCPRCHAPAGLARALAATNEWPVPAACPGCREEQVRYVGFFPARVTHEDGKRTEKPRTQVGIFDAGFHGARVECADCGTVDVLLSRCPLCAAPGPLRARPGG
jgi:hypothetical protein